MVVTDCVGDRLSGSYVFTLFWGGREGAVKVMVNVSMNKDAAGVVNISGRNVGRPVVMGTRSPVASLFNTFNGCVCSGKVDLGSVSGIVLAKIKDTCMGRPLCKLSASRASRFLTGNLKTRCSSRLRSLVMMDVNANASFMGIRKNGGVSRVNNVNVNKKAVRKLSHLLLGARGVRRIMGVTRGNMVRGVSLRVGSVYGAPLPKLPLSTATSAFNGTDSGTSVRSMTTKVVRVMLRSVKRSIVLTTLGDRVGSFILVNGLAGVPRYGRVFPIVRRVCRYRF